MGTVQKTCDFTQQYSDDPPNASLLSLGSLQTLTIHHVNFCGIQGNGSIFNGIQIILSNFIVLRARRERNTTISSHNIQHLYYYLFLTYKPCLCNLEIPQFQLKQNLKYMSISHPKLCEPRHTSPGHLVSSSPKLYLNLDKVSPVVNRTSVKSKKSAPRSRQKRTAVKDLLAQLFYHLMVIYGSVVINHTCINQCPSQARNIFKATRLGQDSLHGLHLFPRVSVQWPTGLQRLLLF